MLFYAAGDFMSRAGSGIGVGSISWHPPGFVHGPQPGSVEAAMEQTRTEELAVMMDTFRSLQRLGSRPLDRRRPVRLELGAASADYFAIDANTSSEVGSVSASRLATSSGLRAAQDPLHRALRAACR